MLEPQPLSPAEPLLVLRTLGCFSLCNTSGETLLDPGKPLALVAYLHALPGHEAARDHLLHTLWSDQTESAARHSLRQATYFLRQRLGDEAITASPGSVTLRALISSDRDEFLEAIDARQLDHAVDIYKGEFLGGFAVPGAIAFDHWADAERQRLRLLFARAAESLAREELGQGHFRRARALAQLVRDAVPLDESGWRLMLEASIAGGDRVSALADGQRLEDLLAAEGRAPAPATLTVLRRARSQPSEPDDSTQGLYAELIGRERPFTALLSAFRRVRRRTAHVVTIKAPAGLGKTRLLHDFALRLAADGKTAIYVRAHPADREVPWSYAASVVRHLAALPGAAGVSSASASTLIALEPSLASSFSAPPDTAADDDITRRRIAAIAELVQAVSDERSLALLIDDLHWADRASSEALQRVTARASETRLLIVFAYRPGTETLLLEHAEALDLDPLSAEQTAAFLSSVGVLPAETWAAEFPGRLAAVTRGSPLLMLETLQLALDTGCLTLVDGRWSGERPDELRELLESRRASALRIMQLDDLPRRLLLALALAGKSLPVEILVTISDTDTSQVAAALHVLERRGLIARFGEGWMAAHDEIASHSEKVATPEQRVEVQAALGKALMLRPNPDLRSAAYHLAAASRHAELATVCRLWLKRARDTGDSRGAGVLVAEMLATSPGDALVRHVVRAMPLAVRMTRTSRLLSGIAVATTVIVSSLLGLARLGSETDLLLTVWQPDSLEWRMLVHNLTAKDFDVGAISIGSFVDAGIKGASHERGAVRPGADGFVAATRAFRDSGGEEVVFLSPGQSPTRITFRPGDDVAGSWSPDGRFVAIQTDRWSSESRSDIAIIDPAHPDSVVVRVSRGAETRDVKPVWSPDGTRIAFVRADYRDSAKRLLAICFASADGKDESCVNTAGYDGVDLIGWASALEIVGEFEDSAGTHHILAVDVTTMKSRYLAEGYSADSRSEAAGWLACYCRRSGAEPLQTLLMSVEDPRRTIRIESGESTPQIGVFLTKRSNEYLDRVAIKGAGRGIPIDGTHRLAVAGWNASGRPIEPLALRWMSRDTSIATIDAAGTIHPRRLGTTRIVVTAGGWRSDSMDITVVASETHVVVDERWTGGYAGRWAAFGVPQPFVATVQEVRALALNGDSTYTSGLYLRERLRPALGFGVEFLLSAPITTGKWQMVYARFISADSLNLSGWDHRSGGIPLGSTRWRSCGAQYPKNTHQRDRLTFTTGVETSVSLPGRVALGEWVRIRMQVFQDGRCGLAVNGKAESISDHSVRLGRSALLLFDGYSYRTKILVGPLTAWTGVRRDVDWSAVERRPSTQRQ